MAISKKEVELIQSNLHCLCYSPGPIDGLLGRRTEGAYSLWQIDSGFEDIITLKDELEKTEQQSSRIENLNFNAQENKDIINMTFPNKESLVEGVCTYGPKFSLNLKAHWAYVLATIEWETNRSFLPIEEAYYIYGGTPSQDDGKWQERENWRKRNFHYYPYFGRGYVQLTWERNYKFYANLFGISLEQMVGKALESGPSLFVILHGMSVGYFGRPIHQYITKNKYDFENARRCVNGLDHAKDIAKLAKSWMRKI